ncbi:MAG: urea carboxylase-associated family protein [Gammaproteobacteria bacterium]|jgi:uncharacterized protein|nr:urea carboxylase-associated family protein [Gammaproteobacteria bacterium]
MSENIIDEFVVPKCTGKAFKVNQGQRLRVIEYEGKQVASLMFFNAHNYKEQFMAEFSGGLNYFQFPTPGSVGSHYRLGELYSKVPYENLMLRVTDNKLGNHFLGTHCTTKTMEIHGVPGHRSCSDNFSDALQAFGLQLEDVYSPSVLNAFANVTIDQKGDGVLHVEPPRSEKGDYIEFQAEMDVLVAVSACPDDQSVINDHSCKAIQIQILEGTD